IHIPQLRNRYPPGREYRRAVDRALTIGGKGRRPLRARILGWQTHRRTRKATAPWPTREHVHYAISRISCNARIHELIQRLNKSENAWIRQAALLALNGPRKIQN